MCTVLYLLTLRTSRAELAEAVLGVSVDQLAGDREPNSIRHALNGLHWGWSGGLPQQQVIVYSKTLLISHVKQVGMKNRW